MHIIEFTPPMQGFEGKFNTFRLGKKYSVILKQGDRVGLVDKKEHYIFALAKVEAILTGGFHEMALRHAVENHNYRELAPELATERLIASMTKRYGPQRIRETSTVTVIFLEIMK